MRHVRTGSTQLTVQQNRKASTGTGSVRMKRTAVIMISRQRYRHLLLLRQGSRSLRIISVKGRIKQAVCTILQSVPLKFSSPQLVPQMIYYISKQASLIMQDSMRLMELNGAIQRLMSGSLVLRPSRSVILIYCTWRYRPLILRTHWGLESKLHGFSRSGLSLNTSKVKNCNLTLTF